MGCFKKLILYISESISYDLDAISEMERDKDNADASDREMKILQNNCHENFWGKPTN